MAAAGQQDMITILLVGLYKFKQNEPWAYCMARMLPIKNQDDLIVLRYSALHLTM